jgi:hypothetical protein
MKSAQKFSLACLSRTSWSASRADKNILRTSANILRIRMDTTTDTIAMRKEASRFTSATSRSALASYWRNRHVDSGRRQPTNSKRFLSIGD